MTRNQRITCTAVGIALFINFGQVAGADELRLLSPKAMQPVLTKLVPEYERLSANTVKVEYGSGSELAKRLQADDQADAAILSPKQHEELERRGKIAPNAIAVAKVGFGIIVRKGAPKPDVSSVDALKQTLLATPSIASGDPKTSASGRLLFDVLERLQIAKEVAPKVKQFPSGSAALAAIGRGEAQIGLEVTTAANGPDIELAGQLPSEVQRFNMYALGLSSRAQHADAAKAFAAFFLSPRGRAIVQEIGFQIPE